MIFDQKNRNCEGCKKLEINGINLEYVEYFKYLGIVLDRRLKMK